MNKVKQIEESYELIMGAFLKLLKVKSFDEITLTEIANNAGVARMTLYRHFKTKEQILIYRAEMQTDHFKLKIKENSPSTTELINSFLIFYRDLPLSQLISTDEHINKIFYPYIVDLRHEFYLHLQNLNYTNFNDYSFDFLIGGFNSIIHTWCDNNFEEDTTYLTEVVMTYVNALK